MENKYKIFDTHSHYDDESFNEDREEVLKEIRENGVFGVLNCSASKIGLETTNKLSLDYDFIYAALGIHPSESNDYNEDVENCILEKVSNNSKVIAIGEIGLDYYFDSNPSKEIQKKVFRAQMSLAEKLNLPVIIHDRDAHKDTLDIMKEYPNVKGIVHCFSGSVEFAKECISLGYYIGVSGIVTFKNAKIIKEVVKEISLEYIVVETDCPYMAPTPNRGKRNKSDYIRYILEQIAEIKEIDVKTVNTIVNKNYSRLLFKTK